MIKNTPEIDEKLRKVRAYYFASKGTKEQKLSCKKCGYQRISKEAIPECPNCGSK